MRFSQIPANHSVKQKLIKSVETGRLAHAQLFMGDEGSASFAIAWAYIQLLFCQNRTEHDSCGECSSCLKVEKMAHPDVHWSFPVISGKQSQSTSDMYLEDFRALMTANPYSTEQQWYQQINADNKQGSISVKEAQELNRKIILKAYEDSFKVILIWHAEKMHTSTSNKLLKLFEEPPEKTIFLLITPKKEQLLPTIISRFQTVQVHPLRHEEMDAFFETKHLSAENRSRLTSLAQGNINKALNLLQETVTVDQQTSRFQKWMRLCYQAKIAELSDWAESISKIGREQQKTFLKYALFMVRECLIFNYASDNLQRLKKEEKEFSIKFAPFIHQNNAMDLIENLETASRDIERNANSRIVFNDLSLKLVLLLRIKSLNLQ